MKKITRNVIALLTGVCMMLSTVAWAQGIENDTYSVPTGVQAEGNIGEGLFNTPTDSIKPFAETGIVSSSMTIEYLPNENVISYRFSTYATDVASEVGMNPIQLQIWDDSIGDWVTVLSNSLYAYNSKSYFNNIIYYSPERGRKYRASGYHYAKINGVNYKLYNETEYIEIP